MSHTLQDRYSQLVDMKLRAALVKKDGVIFNNRYEGDPKAGAVKVPVRDTEVTAASYDKANGVSLTAGSTSYLTITIDKDYAVNELIDGYDADNDLFHINYGWGNSTATRWYSREETPSLSAAVPTGTTSSSPATLLPARLAARFRWPARSRRSAPVTAWRLQTTP